MVSVVIGANYGDEGKGLVSGCLAREARKRNESILTVFYNGTTQRAHTFEGVVRRCTAAGENYGSDTFYYKQFVVDPIPLWLTGSTPIIDGECRLILPFDVLKNREVETSRGNTRHGSCGCGLFEAVKRDKTPGCSVKVKDMLEPYQFYQKVCTLENELALPDDELYNLSNFFRAANWVVSHCKIREFWSIVKNYDHIIFEGGQGLLLDQNNKDSYPHLTPSCTGSFYIADDIKKMGIVPELYYVSRSYLTRHGAGPMPTECEKDEINPDIVDETNQENEYQGKLRFGKLNMSDMKNSVLNDAALYPQRKINMVFTQMNYTDRKLVTTRGCEDVCADFAHNIYVSDQKDQMELL